MKNQNNQPHKMLSKIFLIIAILISTDTFSQKAVVDSLWDIYNRASNHDTIRLKALNDIARAHVSNNPDTAMILANQEIQIAKIKHQEKYHAAGLIVIANCYIHKGDYPKALENAFQALSINEKIGYRKGVASTYYIMANIYRDQQYPQKAFQYVLMAKRIYQDINFKMGIIDCVNNEGLFYSDKKNYKKAIDKMEEALQLSIQEKDKDEMALCYGNIAIYAALLGQYDKAIKNNKQALEIRKQMDDKKGIAFCYENFGYIYSFMGKCNMALQYEDSTISLSRKIKNINYTMAAMQQKATCYEQLKNYKDAFYSYVKYREISDSIFGIEKSKSMDNLKTQYELDKKDQQIKTEKIIASEQNKRQKTISYAGISTLILTLIFSIFLFNRFKATKKQKHIIEQKQEEIMSSIRYAKRIQDALLKEQNHVSKHLPEHFVLYKPKDIVSGDFYWSLEKQGYWYIAVADCTGHGVPGAFLTMLGTSFLNEINATNQLLSPADILDQLRNRFIKELGQTGNQTGNKDGMDISLVRLDLDTNEIQWAGANNPLYVVTKMSTGIHLIEEKANKQPIGYTENPQPFTNHEKQLQKGDCIYIFSDGYADQFGGPQGKKFMSRNMKETLKDISQLDMTNQKEILNNSFESWKGNLQQIDDVCVICIRA